MNPKMLKEWEESFGVDKLGPIVSFFDHAEPDSELSKQSGRPRFKDVAYIELKTRNDPTASAHTRKATPEDKASYPAQWARYSEQREAIETRPPLLWAIPGMTKAYFEELKALDISDCKDLAEHKKDLHPINHLRDFAIRIMEISHEIRGSERAAVPSNSVGPADNRLQAVHAPRPSTDSGFQYGHIEGYADRGGSVYSLDSRRDAMQKEGSGKQQVQDSPVTFSYEFTA